MRTSGHRLNTAHELCMTKTIATSSAPIHLITGVTAVGPDRAASAAAVGRWIIWSVDGQRAVVHLDSLRTRAKGATFGITLPDLTTATANLRTGQRFDFATRSDVDAWLANAAITLLEKRMHSRISAFLTLAIVGLVFGFLFDRFLGVPAAWVMILAGAGTVIGIFLDVTARTRTRNAIFRELSVRFVRPTARALSR